MTTPKADGTSKRCPHCDQPVSQAKFDEITLDLDEEAGERVIRAKLVPVRTGRPPKPPVPGERMSLGLKVTAEIKSRLDRAAHESGRTQSQEAELRIARTFERQDLLPEVLTLAYGREAAGLLMMFGLIMRKVGNEYHMGSGAADDGSRWTDNAVALGNVAHATLALLDAAKPSDRSVNPDTGLRCALQLLSAVAKPNRKGWFTADHQLTETIRSLLGPTMDRMIKAAKRRRLSVLDSDTQARQRQIATAADAVAMFLALKRDPATTTVGDILHGPSHQEIFEVLTKGLTGRPTIEEIREVIDERKGKVSRKEDEKP